MVEVLLLLAGQSPGFFSEQAPFDVLVLQPLRLEFSLQPLHGRSHLVVVQFVATHFSAGCCDELGGLLLRIAEEGPDILVQGTAHLRSVCNDLRDSAVWTDTHKLARRV